MSSNKNQNCMLFLILLIVLFFLRTSLNFVFLMFFFLFFLFSFIRKPPLYFFSEVLQTTQQFYCVTIITFPKSALQEPLCFVWARVIFIVGTAKLVREVEAFFEFSSSITTTTIGGPALRPKVHRSNKKRFYEGY